MNVALHKLPYLRTLRKSVFVAGIFLCPMLVHAGQIVLQNGDVISGEVKGIEGGMVVWQADKLGEVRLPKNEVQSLTSSTPLKVRGQKLPCVWRELKERRIIFECGEGEETVTKRYPIMGLKHVVPFSQHEEVNYSYGGSLRLTGWKQSGNTKAEYQEIMTEVRWRHGDLRHDLSMTHNSQSTINRDYANNLVFKSRTRRSLMSYSFNWFFLPRWYWANTLSAEEDDNRNVSEEYRLFSGIGHQFWENSRSALDLDMGLQYSRTYLDNRLPDQGPDTYPGLRMATNLRYKLNSGVNLYHKSQFSHSFASPDPGDSRRYEVRADTGMNFPVGFGISANFSVEWTYINHAKDQNEHASRQDTIFRLGANYAW